MAYDQYSNYPPQHQQGYYNQPRAPQGGPPRQAQPQAYNNYDGYDGYDGYGQEGYGYGYDDYQQGYGNNQPAASYGYQGRPQQRPPPQQQQQYYDDYGMSGGGGGQYYQQPPPQGRGYNGPPRGGPAPRQPPSQGRGYPPPGRGGPPPQVRQDSGYGEHNQGYQQPPRNNGYQGAPPMEQPRGPPQGYGQRPPQGPPQTAAPQAQPVQAQPPPQPRPQRRPTAESQESKTSPQQKPQRERILQSQPPIVLSQDNAFPTFPTSKPKPDPLTKAMADMSLEKADKADARPANRRPSKPSQPGGYDAQGYPQGAEPPRGGTKPQRGQSFDDVGYQNAPPRGRPQGDFTQQQRPPPARSASARPERMQERRAYDASTGPVSPLDPNFNAPNRSLTMPHNMQNHQPVQQWTEPGPVAGYHGPESPSYIPPRPSTSGSNRQPMNGFSRANGQNYPPMPAMAPKQQQQQQQQPQPQPYGDQQKHESMGDFYDNYYNEDPVEERMPNFDAQPQPQPSHRRDKTLHMQSPPASAAPPMPGIPQAYANNGQAAPSHGFYQQSQMSRSQPNLGQSNGFVAEMPGDVPAVPQMPNGGFGGAAPAPRGLGDLAGGPRGRMANQSPAGFAANGQPRQAPIQRTMTAQTGMSDPGPRQNGVQAYPGQPVPPPAPNSATPEVQAMRMSNPDALPSHPTPVRPGLMDGQQRGTPQPGQMNRPPPVRQYNSNQSAVDAAAVGRAPPERRQSGPVTFEELQRLRGIIRANPQDNKTHLILAKKLVEAASVLADEGGRADTKTRNKNREKYIFEAHKIVKKLVSAGYGEAMFYLADCYGQGLLGLAADPKEAFSLYQAAAKQGHAASAYRTAVCCEMGSEDGGGTRKDPMKAVQWYKRAASLGDVAAMYKMGMILLKGLLGQQKHLGEALNWLKRAAERADEENPHALHELGLLYESPIPGPANDKIIHDEPYAYSLFKQAAELGYKFSQFRLGQAYEYGILTCPIDARQSIYWYTKAAAQEEHQAELALSGWYLTGAAGILDQSDTEAYLWARKAATSEPPLPKAMFAMGYYTEVGIGCPRSLEEAKRWYGRSAAYKFPKAQERLDELKRGGVKVQKNRERLSRSNQRQHEADCVVM